MTRNVCVFLGEQLGTYHFGDAHPFGPKRYGAFLAEFEKRNLGDKVHIGDTAIATDAELRLFHTAEYLDKARDLSAKGSGYLDSGDTPAVHGIFEAAACVVGTSLAAARAVMSGECQRAFVPIAGLHHARRFEAAGFCVFNDCGVVIEELKKQYHLHRILYVDIDAHHGDGVFYSFNSDPEVFILDFHEDGHYLYPGTGKISETGEDTARGTKLNIPLPPDSTDAIALPLWEKCEQFLESSKPEFVLLQCGADSIAGDPITHLQLTSGFHRFVSQALSRLANKHCGGRLLAMGGGGYNLDNLASAWNNVIEGMIEPD